jgi:hypothetical protein
MTDRRRTAGPTLRGALLWAVVGAALFVGVGAALPVWPGGVEIASWRRTEFWWALYDQWLWAQGVWEAWKDPKWQDLINRPGTEDLASGSVALVLSGAATGMLGHLAWFRLRRRKGGAA